MVYDPIHGCGGEHVLDVLRGRRRLEDYVPHTKRPRIYIAGPYTKGDPVLNTRTAILTGSKLLARGFTPFVPHLTMFWHMLDPQDYEVWLNFDFEWVKTCDGLLRLEGESSGADREVRVAVEHKIPVFFSLDSLYAYQWQLS